MKNGRFGWVHSRLPKARRLGKHWRRVMTLDDGAKYLHADGFSVIMSGMIELDGKRWIHLSVAHPLFLPPWDVLATVKDLFLGPEVEALQVLPRRSEHINIHPNCLHLWHCIEGRQLPDFTWGSGSI